LHAIDLVAHFLGRDFRRLGNHDETTDAVGVLVLQIDDDALQGKVVLHRIGAVVEDGDDVAVHHHGIGQNRAEISGAYQLHDGRASSFRATAARRGNLPTDRIYAGPAARGRGLSRSVAPDASIGPDARACSTARARRATSSSIKL